MVLLDLSLPDSSGLDTPDKGAQDYLVKRQFNEPMLSRGIRYGIERRRAQEEIKEQNEFVRAIIESIPYAFYVVDATDYSIVMATP